MSSVLSDVPPTQWTLADVQLRLPGFPSNRIRSYPSPGTATEQDVLQAEARDGRICELIDATLVEKIMASLESMLAAELIYFIRRYLETNDIGMLLAGDGLLKIFPAQVRAPDVAFIRWTRFPNQRPPKAAIYAVCPDLAVEVLSEGNTPEEMDRKLRDYFMAGAKLVWYIQPVNRTARAFTGEHDAIDIGPDGSLTGGDVLPGFSLPLAHLFARVDGPRQA
jgi:Uma2 family endonuclease